MKLQAKYVNWEAASLSAFAVWEWLERYHREFPEAPPAAFARAEELWQLLRAVADAERDDD